MLAPHSDPWGRMTDSLIIYCPFPMKTLRKTDASTFILSTPVSMLKGAIKEVGT